MYLLRRTGNREFFRRQLYLPLLAGEHEEPSYEGLGYESTFRVAIVEFLDAHNFCLGRVKRSCVHFVTPAGQIIPFDTYNLFYRDGRIDEIRRAMQL